MKKKRLLIKSEGLPHLDKRQAVTAIILLAKRLSKVSGAFAVTVVIDGSPETLEPFIEVADELGLPYEVVEEDESEGS